MSPITSARPSTAKSKHGAPSQHSQSSRKGKRAWRKHIDIQPVEEGLESLRAEERVVGSILQKRTDDQLFVVDTKGDERVRASAPRCSKRQPTATKILSQRSAVPAVLSRAPPTTTASGARLSRADKERLLRIARRPRKGLLNAVVDPRTFGAGSAPVEVSYAVRQSGGRDLWDGLAEEEGVVVVVPDGLEALRKRSIKKPDVGHPRDVIDVPAVSVPPLGASYNPPVRAHEALLGAAYDVEKRRREEADRLDEARRKIEGARAFDGAVNGPDGMIVDAIGEEDDDGEETADDEAPLAIVVHKKRPVRKTKQQRARMARHKAEKRTLAEKALRKRLLHAVNEIKSLRADLSKVADAQQQARLGRQLALRTKLRRGLAGRRLGKHRVPKDEIEVQIGEDLSENLRGLKPEGNLFRDRFVSLQQRALIEPRARVLPTKRKAKRKEYEKHAWKRFE